MEVVVATVVASIVVLAARELYDALTMNFERVRQTALMADARMNGERVLRQVVRNAEAHLDQDSTFVGDPVSAAFVSSCQTPWGWLERQRITLSVSDSEEWSLVTVRCGRQEGTVAMRARSPVVLQYLTTEALGNAWLDSWSAGQMPPRAIGIKTKTDTLILPIGVRW
jgi:hypothetical protein